VSSGRQMVVAFCVACVQGCVRRLTLSPCHHDVKDPCEPLAAQNPPLIAHDGTLSIRSAQDGQRRSLSRPHPAATNPARCKTQEVTALRDDSMDATQSILTPRPTVGAAALPDLRRASERDLPRLRM
jgi:hypothetical protein